MQKLEYEHGAADLKMKFESLAAERKLMEEQICHQKTAA